MNSENSGAEKKLSHVDASGKANMVDVTDKSVTQRRAIASGYVEMDEETLTMITDHKHKKGDVISVARIAGIQAAKKCSDLIPLCHPLMLTKVSVEFSAEPAENRMYITAMCKLAGQTGVEMEALTAVSVAALTLFDMCKAVDPQMQIGGIHVIEKQGGKTGNWSNKDTSKWVSRRDEL